MEIDLAAIQAEVEQLSAEELQKLVVDAKVRQKVARSYQDPEKQKAYRKQRYEQVKLAVARAKELGIYDELVKKADAIADEKLKAKAAEADETADDEAA